MKILPILLVVLGVACFFLPAFISSEEAPWVAFGSMFGILFFGVGASILVANMVCSKKR
ncbi:MAG: hypothetical protein WEB60_13320 [Terrimicrobiaceae bacterium]